MGASSTEKLCAAVHVDEISAVTDVLDDGRCEIVEDHEPGVNVTFPVGVSVGDNIDLEAEGSLDNDGEADIVLSEVSVWEGDVDADTDVECNGVRVMVGLLSVVGVSDLDCEFDKLNDRLFSCCDIDKEGVDVPDHVKVSLTVFTTLNEIVVDAEGDRDDVNSFDAEDEADFDAGAVMVGLGTRGTVSVAVGSSEEENVNDGVCGSATVVDGVRDFVHVGAPTVNVDD